MSDGSIRLVIVDVLLDAAATEDLDSERIESFTRGEDDISFEELNLDSMLRMELMVAVEMEFSVIVSPQEFARLGSLGELASHVTQSSAAMDTAQAPPREEEAAPHPIRLFRRALHGCRTIAQFHRLVFHMEGRLTPEEAATFQAWHRDGKLLGAGSPTRYGGAVADWLDALQRSMASSGSPSPEPFTSERIAPSAVHFRGPGDRSSKTLLIGFSNIGSRIVFVPTAVLLQHIDAHRFDVLMISDPLASAFRTGIPFMGGSVTEVVDWVANLPWLKDYDGLRVMGGSAGAYPAMLAGRRLSADLTVGISGRFPSERHLWTLLKMYFHSWVSWLRNRKAPVLLVHGTGRRGDVAYARRLTRLTGASRLAVHMPDRAVEHNIMEPMVAHGELAHFLGRTILATSLAGFTQAESLNATLTYPIPHPPS